jgi:glycosyltransferase involved in cell wall biosynthesis
LKNPKGDDWVTQFEKRILNSLNSESFVFCVSNNTKKDLLKLSSLPSERIEVFYPGIKDELQTSFLEQISLNEIKQKIKLPENSKYILALSTIIPRKNVQTILNIIDKITDSNPEFDLYLVFIGDWSADVKFWESLTLKNKNQVRFTGYVSDEYLPCLYLGALCLLYPSLYEGFGMPLVEAMSYGTPVVTSNRGSIPEVVGDDTETFDAYDVDGMVKKILNWCRNPDQRQRDGQIAYQRSKFFTWNKAVDKILDFIKSKQ